MDYDSGLSETLDFDVRIISWKPGGKIHFGNKVGKPNVILKKMLLEMYHKCTLEMFLCRTTFVFLKKSEEIFLRQDMFGCSYFVNQCFLEMLFLVNDCLLKSATPAIVKHGMTVQKQAIEFLNPEQIPVTTFDQPLFALAKIVQWKWPEVHVTMLGGLHTETALWNTMEDLLEDSGWTAALTEADVATA